MMKARHSAYGLLLPFIAFVLGGAIGAIVVHQRGEEPVARVSSSDQGNREWCAEINARLGAIERALEQLGRTLERVSTSAVAAAHEVGGERVPIGPAPDLAASGDAGGVTAPTGWLANIDSEIGQVLVERGLTPYVDGVGKLVARAGNAIREAQREYEGAVAPLKQFIADNLTDPQCKEYERDIVQRREQLTHRRALAIKVLIEALDAR